MSSHDHTKFSPPVQASGPERGRPGLPLVGIFGAALVAGVGLTLGTMAYAYTATHPKRRALWRTPTDESLPYEEVTFPARDGLKIGGWLIAAPSGVTAKGVVCLCHGYPFNRTEMLPYAKFLYRAGYTALLFDFRAMGESEGDLCSVGHHEVQDLEGALDYLASRPDTAELPFAALGLSLGAAVAIMTAAQDERLKAVVAEASFPTLTHALNARCQAVFGPLGTTVARPIIFWGRRWFPVAPHTVAPIEAIANIAPRAIMIVQGQRDPLVRWRDAVAMYERAGEPRELWLLPDSGHARCLRDEPDEYARRAVAFFDRHL